MSFFSLFCCCLRPRPHFLPTNSDENAPLIPASDDVQPAARHIIIDQQRMKERLGIIVRAKEGKMVNVNAPLPFNLNSNNQRQPRLSRLRTRSPQPSLEAERQSVVSSASASGSQELDEDMRWPTLNVRIVRGGSALARGRPIMRDTASHEPRTEGEETGPAPTAAAAAVASVAEENRAEVQSGVAGNIGDAARLAGTAFKIQNVGSLSQSWGD